MIRPRKAYGAVKRRVVGFLAQPLRSRDARAWALRRSPGDPVLCIVAEKDMPYPFAPFMYAHWLKWLAGEDPLLRSRIELAHLPAGLPANTTALHAWVQDPVRERSTALYAQLRELEERAERAGARVIQPVDVLSNSLRDTQYACLSRAGVRSPKVVLVGERFAEDLGGLALPIVVRKNWGHGTPMQRLDTRTDVDRWLEQAGDGAGAWAAQEYIEVRGDDGFYRKYRSVFFGERMVRRHLIVSKNWEVRPSDRVMTKTTRAEELEFLAGSHDERVLLDAARRELGFDIAAFDYSFDSDGRIVVWEVNPFPDLSIPPGRVGRHLAPSIHLGYRALADFYREQMANAV